MPRKNTDPSWPNSHTGEIMSKRDVSTTAFKSTMTFRLVKQR